MKISFHSPFARQIFMAAIVILALTLTGWVVARLDLSRLCIGWPLCIPRAPLGWLQVLHRFLAGTAGVLILNIFHKAWKEQRHQLVILPLTTVCTLMFFGQIFVGALQATSPTFHLRVLHALTTISLWIALAVLMFVSSLPANPKENDKVLPRFRRLKDFIRLTKPWIVALLLVTTIAGLVTGYQGVPPFSLVFWTLLGGALAAGGSSALNQYIDRELDKHMQRTAQRPLAAQRLTNAEGLAFGLALCIASYYILATLVNLLAAILALIGIFYYVCVYSLWLKKATAQNIVIGGGAGAIPPMVGWAAATGHLPLAAWILFAIIFVWTPPHFWALAIIRRKDYERAGIPMLPVVRGEEETRRQILLYTMLLVAVSLLLPALQLAGSIYLLSALGLGSVLLYAAWKVWRVPGNKVAFLMYRWSSLYLLFIFIALMIDTIYGRG
jgi:protoheme IX farnesyltransferase